MGDDGERTGACALVFEVYCEHCGKAMYGGRSSRAANVDSVGHDFVQAEFVGQLVNRRKIYPGELRDTLLRVFTVRQSADYNREFVSERQVHRVLQRATDFVEAVATREAGRP